MLFFVHILSLKSPVNNGVWHEYCTHTHTHTHTHTEAQAQLTRAKFKNFFSNNAQPWYCNFAMRGFFMSATGHAICSCT